MVNSLLSGDGLLSTWTAHPIKLGRVGGEGKVRSSSLSLHPAFHYYVDGSSLPLARSTPKKRSQIIVRSEPNHARDRGREGKGRATHSCFFGLWNKWITYLGRDGA